MCAQLQEQGSLRHSREVDLHVDIWSSHLPTPNRIAPGPLRLALPLHKQSTGLSTISNQQAPGAAASSDFSVATEVTRPPAAPTAPPSRLPTAAPSSSTSAAGPPAEPNKASGVTKKLGALGRLLSGRKDKEGVNDGDGKGLSGAAEMRRRDSSEGERGLSVTQGSSGGKWLGVDDNDDAESKASTPSSRVSLKDKASPKDKGGSGFLGAKLGASFGRLSPNAKSSGSPQEGGRQGTLRGSEQVAQHAGGKQSSSGGVIGAEPSVSVGVGGGSSGVGGAGPNMSGGTGQVSSAAGPVNAGGGSVQSSVRQPVMSGRPPVAPGTTASNTATAAGRDAHARTICMHTHLHIRCTHTQIKRSQPLKNTSSRFHLTTTYMGLHTRVCRRGAACIYRACERRAAGRREQGSGSHYQQGEKSAEIYTACNCHVQACLYTHPE